MLKISVYEGEGFVEGVLKYVSAEALFFLLLLEVIQDTQAADIFRPFRQEILKRLRAAGAPFADVFPRFQRELVDLPFLQLAIEHGLRGFPRVPHWTPAVRQASNQAGRWVAARSAEIESALTGDSLPPAEQKMDRALERKLAKRRREGWP